jgi:hypothetical protein
MALKRLAAAGVLLIASVARADDTGATTDDHDDSWQHYIQRRHALAILEGGIIILPNAPVSASQKGGNIPILSQNAINQGDATIQLGIHILYRPFRDWSFGANFFFDPRPTSDSQYDADIALPRTHARSYFFIGGEARYIPLHARSIEGWVGAQAGVVIVADRFTTNAGIPVPAIFGDQEVSLATEGFFIGAQLGVDWYISDRIVAGLVTRYNHWLLPEQPKCSPILDCTTLTGNVDSFDFGFTLAYRLSL